MLNDEISQAQRLVRTDAYQMSIGEIVSMYESSELIVNPDFQRLFRWSISQKSRLIESLLLGIPIPSIFVFEKDDGKWELIDGLQRVSTILEFMGVLKKPDGGIEKPSILDATKYLPSLHNAVWELSERISEVPIEEQADLPKVHQLAIRRARIGVEILKRPSDNKTKFDLFQRLNAGGTQANAQELRNCIMLMVNDQFFRSVKAEAEHPPFTEVVDVSPEQREKQRHMELAVRFLVHVQVPYNGTLDVEEYIDEGIVEIASAPSIDYVLAIMRRTFEILNASAGRDALRRFDGARHIGKVGLVGLEGIAVGVAKNLAAIDALPQPIDFTRQRIREFWSQPEIGSFISPGLRGTTRIQRTVPFGERWFRP
jgi:Protein of unknown function DUF262